jgi:hypothetical protein
MVEEKMLSELVKPAQQDDENSMSQLAQEVEGGVRAYVYRVTLDHDLTQGLGNEPLRVRERLLWGCHLFGFAEDKYLLHIKKWQ